MSRTGADRLLSELGVARYRLRASPPVAEPALVTAAAASPERPPMAAARLTVFAPGTTASPDEAAAAAIWQQVLDWLGLSAGEVAWSGSAETATVRLPEPRAWTGPAGKRGLWQALKGHVRSAADDTGAAGRRRPTAER